jgi:UDP-N-acetylmuramoyl-L-alanyl-D-glutamate--2,6-diaminopimelate ligase
MNKEKIQDILRNWIVDGQLTTDVVSKIDSVTTNLQDSTSNQIVFYKLTGTESAEEVLEKRLASADPGLLILNKIPEIIKVDCELVVIEQENFLKAQKELLDEIYPFESEKLKIVGVTGTNGKTTVVNLCAQLASFIGKNAASLGTLGLRTAEGEELVDVGATTPSYVELRKILFGLQEKFDVLFMEVSSHALTQDRLYDIKIDFGAWISFSQDHLDYHSDMHHYFESKLLLIDKYLKGDGKVYLPKEQRKLFEKISDARGDKNLLLAPSLSDRGHDEVPEFCRAQFNKNNIEMALILNELLFEKDLSNFDLTKFRLPPGRYSLIELEDGIAIIDYAHTPDALENILDAVKQAYPKKKMTVVFGCGGDRDRAKRPMMGSAASKYADEIIITSDNPRSEKPEDIIEEISGGIYKSHKKIPNRRDAIIYALGRMSGDDVVVIAGKGHEDYQEIDGVKIKFSDFRVVDGFRKGSL